MIKIKFLITLGISALCFYSFLLHAQIIPQTRLLHENWQVISSQAVNNITPEQLSTTNYHASFWYHAAIPSTVLNVLVQNGVYQKNILDGLTLKDIAQESFDEPWWYRTTFDLDTLPPNAQLELDGINYRADIWLNGKQIADKTSIYGSFKQYQLNITPDIRQGMNVLAIKVYPPKSDDFRIGFTDWNPNPPDRNMGVIRGVKISLNQGLELKAPFIHTELNTPNNDQAKLTIQLTAVNHQADTVTADIIVTIDHLFTLKKTIYLAAHEQKLIMLTPKENKELNIAHPKLWWPQPMGEPYLYHATISIHQHNNLSDLKSFDFGVRKIETFLEPYQENNQPTPSYYRGFKINGQPLLIRGAAWTDSMLLNDTPQQVRDQLHYVKAMHLNAIRLEGFWGNDKTLYETCDQLGLLVMIGWSAQWEWPLRGFRKPEQCDPRYGCYTTAEDKALIVASFKDQIIWLRNHPSIFVWMFGSDLKPMPDLESKLASLLQTLNPGIPYVISAAEKLSAWDNQPSGIKMRGPYIYVPPVYWFENNNEGGAFGFNSETCPGAEVPPLESLQRLLQAPQDNWPNNRPAWVYHLGDHPKLQNFDRYDAAMAARYGVSSSLAEYAQKSQLMNYESVRPMFEAFIAYRAGNPYLNGVPATGIFHWMLNAAWPKFFWQLYDYYLVPGSAYFSAKEANKPLHVLYNYANKNIYLSNHTLNHHHDLDVSANLWDAHSNLLSEQHWHTSIAATQTQTLGPLIIPEPITTTVFFVELTLKDKHSQRLDHNVYWLSTTPDQLGKDTSILQNADYHQLHDLPQTHLIARYTFIDQGSEKKLLVNLENNTDSIAFFNRLMVKTASNTFIVPIDWSDNFITLFPHQTETITAQFSRELLQNQAPILTIEGINATFDMQSY